MDTSKLVIVAGLSPISHANSRLGFEVGLLANAAQYESELLALKAFGSVTTVGGFVAGSMLTSWTLQLAQLPVVVHSLLPARKISVGRTRPLTSIPLSVRVPVSIFSMVPAVLSTT